MTKADYIRSLIENAFDGVCLDGGVSLDQAQAYDDNMEGITQAEFEALHENEETENWRAVPFEALDTNPCLAFFDKKAFRYYIPAYMLSLIDRYDPTSMRVISTLSELCPEHDLERRHIPTFAILDEAQSFAVASFLEALPEIVNLDNSARELVALGLRQYWGQFLRNVVRPGDNVVQLDTRRQE